MRLIFSSTLILLLFFAGSLVFGQDQSTNFPVGPQYLITPPPTSYTGITILQPIATPSMSPSQPYGVTSPQTGEAEPITGPAVEVPANLPAIYWGWGPPPVPYAVEPGEPSASAAFPAGYIDTGVSALTTINALNAEDYGESVAQAARYWRKHELHAAHVYTNQDLEHLNGE
jgi:hypothetical protein